MTLRPLFRSLLGFGLLFASKAQALPATDYLVAVPYLAKAGVGLTLCSWMLSDPIDNDLLPGILLPTGVIAVLVVPELYTLGALAFAEDGRTIRTARRYAYASEMIVGGLAVVGGMVILSGNGRGSEIGFAPLLAGLAMLAIAQADLIPFASEKSRRSPPPATPIATLRLPF